MGPTLTAIKRHMHEVIALARWAMTEDELRAFQQRSEQPDAQVVVAIEVHPGLTLRCATYCPGDERPVQHFEVDATGAIRILGRQPGRRSLVPSK